jgi:hypothetical protein
MDLLACAECGHRFYVPGIGPSDRHHCPHCGGGLGLAAHGVTAIPLDARWLDPRLSAREQSPATVVELRFKRDGVDSAGERIVDELADYFPLRGNGRSVSNGRSVKVSVNRGEPADAALRVAAVLDGVDGEWEEHFYLSTADSQDLPRARPARRSRSVRKHLRLVASNGPGPEQADPA